MIKPLNKLGTEGSIIKVIYDMHTANIILKGKKLKAFLLRPGARLECPHLPHLFNIVLDLLARARKINKSQPIRKEEIRLSLFTNV